MFDPSPAWMFLNYKIGVVVFYLWRKLILMKFYAVLVHLLTMPHLVVKRVALEHCSRLVLMLLVLTGAGVLSVAPNKAQLEGYDIEVEVVNPEIGVLSGGVGTVDLTGYATYRLWITMDNADDFLSSISGTSNNPTYVRTTTSFYHALLGAETPNGINPVLYGVYLDLPYDSWVTIGLEEAPNVGADEADISTVQSSANPWTTIFDPGGADIAIDDAIGGAWYAFPGDTNGVAVSDGAGGFRVLAGQFTTDGDLSGQLYTQIFINGDNTDQLLETFFFGDVTVPEPSSTLILGSTLVMGVLLRSKRRLNS